MPADTGLVDMEPGLRGRRRTDLAVHRVLWPGYAADIWTNSPRLLRVLGLCWPLLRPSRPHRSSQPPEQFMLGYDRTQHCPSYFLRGGSGPLGVWATLGEALNDLDQRLRASFVRWCSSELVLVQATVIGAEAGVAAVVGPSSPARSSVTARLVQAGYAVLSPSWLVIDIRGRQLLSCSGPVHLWEDDWQCLAEVRQPPVAWPIVDATGRHGRLAVPIPPEAATWPWRLRLLLMADDGSARSPVLQAVAPDTARQALADSAINLPAHGELGYSALACLTEKAASFRVSSVMPDVVLGVVRQAMGASRYGVPGCGGQRLRSAMRLGRRPRWLLMEGDQHART